MLFTTIDNNHIRHIIWTHIFTEHRIFAQYKMDRETMILTSTEAFAE